MSRTSSDNLLPPYCKTVSRQEGAEKSEGTLKNRLGQEKRLVAEHMHAGSPDFIPLPPTTTTTTTTWPGPLYPALPRIAPGHN